MKLMQLAKTIMEVSAKDRGFSPTNYLHGKDTKLPQIHTNISKDERFKIARLSKRGAVRGVRLKTGGDTYWWDADNGLHTPVAIRIGIIDNLTDDDKIDKFYESI